MSFAPPPPPPSHLPPPPPPPPTMLPLPGMQPGGIPSHYPGGDSLLIPPPPRGGVVGGPGLGAHAGGGSSGPPRPSFQVLFTNLPKHLHNNRTIRDWLASTAGGSVRNVLFVPTPRKDANVVPTTTETSEATLDVPITALITMSNADSALKVVACFRYCKKKFMENDSQVDGAIAESFQTMTAHPVPIHPDIPLPPAILDPESTQILGDKLYHSYMATYRQHYNISSSSHHNNENMDPSSRSTNRTSSSNPATTTTSTANDDDAGYNNYDNDEDEDPLNAPAVLEAVQRFRQNLEKLQGTKATRRKELVQTKLAAALPLVREKMKVRQQQPPLPLPTNLPLPPPPPPSSTTNAPPGAPRGVSNLPAWMTQQQQEQHELSDSVIAVDGSNNSIDEPATKRMKTSEDDNGTEMDLSSSSFPSIPEERSNELRSYISQQIQQLLGVEEVTLIEFIQNHILGQKTVATLLPELEQVLEEEAVTLLHALWNQVNDLAK